MMFDFTEHARDVNKKFGGFRQMGCVRKFGRRHQEEFLSGFRPEQLKGWFRNSYSFAPHGNYGLALQGCGMIAKQRLHQFDAGVSRYVRQPNDPTMGCAVNINELGKIIIDGNKDASLLHRQFKQFPVSRISSKSARFKHVVPLTLQPFGKFATSTSINKESHLFSVAHSAVTRTLSSES